MNVLIITGIFPPDIGGPASYVPDIAAALAQRGHKITVITLSDTTALVTLNILLRSYAFCAPCCGRYAFSKQLHPLSARANKQTSCSYMGWHWKRSLLTCCWENRWCKK